MPLQQVVAANPGAQGQAAVSGLAVQDVALQGDGILKGQVTDRQGAPCKNMPVRVLATQPAPRVLAATKTDEQGHFQVGNLEGGVYVVQTVDGGGFYRAWTPQTAPPTAVRSVLLVQGEDAARGRFGKHRIGPLGWTLIGLGIAAAIAIPLALDDDDAS
jgi:hypothetical protein